MPRKRTATISESDTRDLVPLVLRICEFCKLYDVSKGQFYKEWRAKRIEAKKEGRWVRIHRAEAERWFASHSGLAPAADASDSNKDGE